MLISVYRAGRLRHGVYGSAITNREPDYRDPKHLVGGNDPDETSTETIVLPNNACNEKGAKSPKLGQCIMYTKYNLSVKKKAT